MGLLFGRRNRGCGKTFQLATNNSPRQKVYRHLPPPFQGSGDRNHQGVPERRSDEGMQQSEESHRHHTAQEGERNHRQMGTLR